MLLGFIVVLYGLALLLSYPHLLKESCLKNLLIDLEEGHTASFYDFEGFRCGYKTTTTELTRLGNLIERQIQDKNGRSLDMRTVKYTFFYTARPYEDINLIET